jgi:O-antigen/teichoic acid export membrane protein
MSVPAGRAEIVRGVSWVAASHVVGQLAWFGSLLIIAAFVSPSAFGSVAIGMVVVQVAWLLVGSGTRGSFVLAPHVTAAQVRYAVVVNVGTGLAVGVAAALLAGPLAPLLASGADVGVLRVLFASIGLYGLSVVPLALLQRELRFKRHALVNAVSAATSSVVAVAAVLVGAGVWALVLRQVLFQTLLACLGWLAARSILPSSGAGGHAFARRPPHASGFFVLALLAFASLNVDNVVVGRNAGAARLGLYALAFTIAFAPATQFAWQIGKVLFPVAARTAETATVAGRALKAVMLTALVLFPWVPPAAVLAPVLLPRLLGPQWQAAVGPLQLLLAVGVVQAVLAVLREFLLGTGHVRLFVKIDSLWLAGTIAALLVLVPLDGIEGAALAHLILLIPLAGAYVCLGLPRLGLNAQRLVRSLGGVLVAVGTETAVVAILAVVLPSVGVSAPVAAGVAAASGLAVVASVLWHFRSGTLSEAWSMVEALRQRPVPTV